MLENEEKLLVSRLFDILHIYQTFLSLRLTEEWCLWLTKIPTIRSLGITIALFFYDLYICLLKRWGNWRFIIGQTETVYGAKIFTRTIFYLRAHKFPVCDSREHATMWRKKIYTCYICCITQLVFMSLVWIV